jgi:hypothetical protein
VVQPPLKRPLPQVLASQVAPDGRPVETLGRWQDGRFTFNSSASEAAWHKHAYAQGIHPRDWHRGREIDEDTARLVEGGMAGATAPFYRGPDGSPRFGNQHTIEPPAQRALRQRAFAGKTLDQIAAIHRSTGKLPGEEEAAALTPRNDNQSPREQPKPATIASYSAAIQEGMSHARESEQQVIAKLAQATQSMTDPIPVPADDVAPISPAIVNDANPQPRFTRAPLRGKMPTAPIDAPRKAELLIFQPVGDGQSSLGHVAIEISGLLYSWAPGGLHLTTKEEYLAANRFRDATGYPLRLTDDETKRLESYILKYANAAKYNPATANCTDMVEQGLEALGYDIGLTVLPTQLQKALIANQLASKDRSISYPAHPSKKSPPATKLWSVMSRPE